MNYDKIIRVKKNHGVLLIILSSDTVIFYHDITNEKKVPEDDDLHGIELLSLLKQTQEPRRILQ